MTHLRDADFEYLGIRLRNELNARRVWVQYSNNKSLVSVCITVFYNGIPGYRMYFGKRITDFSYDKIRSLIKD